eukprot:gene6148-10155_t
MKTKVLIFVLFVFLNHVNCSVLEEYVNRADPSYSYKLHTEFAYIGGTGYLLNVTSQTWLSKEEMSHPTIRHWVVILKPTKLVHTKKPLMILVNGQSKEQEPPTVVPNLFAPITALTNSIVVLVFQIPFQRVSFPNHGEPKFRQEDDLIAYSWKLFMNTGKTDFVQQLPMVKSTVKCMEASKDFITKNLNLPVEQFVVAGVSKLGWTTLLTAAVRPKEVAAIIPIVIPVLNLTETFDRIHSSYCKWPRALKDYEREGILSRYHTPVGQKLFDIVDPLNFKHILNMPKYFITATGDEFFIPDSTEHFFKQLQGESLLRNIPNTGHIMKDSDFLLNLVSYYHSFINNVNRPNIKWENKFEETRGVLEVVVDQKPMAVRLWVAHNENARDFSLPTIGQTWKSTLLKESSPGVYKAELRNPVKGYLSYLIELKYPSRTVSALTFTTSAFVIPNKFPCGPPAKK